MAYNDFSEMLSTKTLLRGVYQIDEYLASGGFGNTYAVTHKELGERYAIKEFYMKGISERAEDATTVRVSNTQNRNQFESQRRKFKKEALRLRKLDNPHIVHVYDLFEENGTAYYVMDLIEGVSLKKYIEEKKCPMPEEDVRHLLPQILDALAAVHAKGFQHLDLKPGNIMIDSQKNVTLIDFGASKQMDNEEGVSTSTAMAFTPGYAPREQVEQNLNKLGPWTDLYALGATLYNLLSNTLPPLPSDIDDYKEAAFKFPDSISTEMKKLILWLMMPNRKDRPQSVAIVQDWLQKGNETEVVEEATVVGMNKGEATVIIEGNEIPSPSPKPQPDPEPKPTPKPKPNPTLNWLSHLNKNLIATLAIAICLGGGITWYALYVQGGGEEENSGEIGQPSQLVKDPTQIKQPPVSTKTTAVTNKSFTNPVMKEYTYTGPVDKDGLPHGKGEARIHNGDTFTGEFNHGTFEGQCTYLHANGDVFKGTFKDNKRYDGKYTTAKTRQYVLFTKGVQGEWITP